MLSASEAAGSMGPLRDPLPRPSPAPAVPGGRRQPVRADPQIAKAPPAPARCSTPSAPRPPRKRAEPSSPGAYTPGEDGSASWPSDNSAAEADTPENRARSARRPLRERTRHVQRARPPAHTARPHAAAGEREPRTCGSRVCSIGRRPPPAHPAGVPHRTRATASAPQPACPGAPERPRSGPTSGADTRGSHRADTGSRTHSGHASVARGARVAVSDSRKSEYL